MKLIFCFILICVTILSCNQVQRDEAGSIENPSARAVQITETSPIIIVDPRLEEADSLVIVYYKDPHGEDSLRYTRYYNQVSITDPATIAFFKQNLKENTERFEKVRNCRSEGKIWCFKDGAIFQTLYFSAKDLQCSFVYIIKNGLFYYSPIQPGLVKKLQELKARAVEI